MSLLATASCDQFSGYYWRSGGVVRVWWCKGRALGRGWEGVADEGAPHENWRNSLATRERISTKWGSPFISNQTVREPNDRDWRQGEDGIEGGGAPVQKYLNDCLKKNKKLRDWGRWGCWSAGCPCCFSYTPSKISLHRYQHTLRVSLNVSQHLAITTAEMMKNMQEHVGWVDV